MDEAQIERQRIEMVFGLTGGELGNEPWTYTADGVDTAFPYWYDGAPDYVERHDVSDLHCREYRTAVVDELCGLSDTPNGWERRMRFASSGETECGCKQDESHDGEPDPDCLLCEGDGIVYIGDGWAEVVYRKRDDDACDKD
mgnify:CR=1 FL=1